MRVFVLLLACLAARAGAQEFRGEYTELFFGRLASARSEAMGRVQAAGGDVQALYGNPAALASAHGATFWGSTASPYYLNLEARYEGMGAAFCLGRWGTAALGRYVYDAAPNDDNSTASTFYQNALQLYSVSWALPVAWGVTLGANVHLFRVVEGEGDEQFDQRVWPVDVGMDWRIWQADSDGGGLSLGASLSNVSNAVVGSGMGEHAIPRVLRMGGAFDWRLQHGPGGLWPPDRVTLSLAFQDVLNADYRSGWRSGVEAVFWRLFMLRGGYYSEKLTGGVTLSDLTYGLGLQLPLDLFSDELPAWTFAVDLAHMPQPDFSGADIGWESFTVLTARLTMAPLAR